jgi:hypothetical protein
MRVFPEIPSFKTQNKTVFAAAENIPKFGIAAGSFGLYKSGKLHFFEWDKVSVKESGTLETNGVIYDLASVKYNGQEGVLVTAVYDTGSAVLEIYTWR